MMSMRNQRGLSMWIALLLVICLAFMGLIGLKLGPVYLESLKIDRAIEGLFEGEDLTKMSKNEIRDALVRRLDIDSVESVTYKNFWDLATVDKDVDEVTLNIVYEVVVPIAGNVSALVEFTKTATDG